MRISSNQMNTSGLQEILKRQTELRDLQLRMATQKKFLTPADDPVAATTILNIDTDVALTEQYNRNADLAVSAGELEEGVLNSVTNISFRLKELFVSIGNGTYSGQELDALKTEIIERYEELIGLANTQNSSGDYIFSGFQIKTEPFTKDVSGNVLYNGDQGQRELRISSGVKVPISDSGYDIFVNSLSGNGDIDFAANPANTGSGIIEPKNSATNNILNDYEIQFTSSTTYDIVDVTNAVTVVAGATYTSGADISYTAGTESFTVAVEGEPLLGDVFTVEPSRRQSIFSTLESVISAIDNYVDLPAEKAIFRSSMNSLDGALDNFMGNIDIIRAKIGARLNTIDSELNTNRDLIVSQKSTLSKLQDLNVVEAASELSRQTAVLDAAQASFVRVQNLSIFRFL
ncbi:flagellar hook-associated protein FlgL [Pleionea sediminis]|uniref:flagellar hook-associated protein FlgL n=1 Tax=Pleionea sediminis TaxID=2569479 RepID=UPI001185C263|nr:flagellar hook-associated protein FlgL [Pleionea sediminis]